jgi:hypothetical protein
MDGLGDGGDPLLFVGDFNTGIGPADGPINNSGDVDPFMAIQEAGFIDTWRHIHSDLVEHTYTFPRNGKLYRIDRTCVMPKCLGSFSTLEYMGAVRANTVS